VWALNITSGTATLTDNQASTIAHVSGYPKTWNSGFWVDDIWVVTGMATGVQHTFTATWSNSYAPSINVLIASGGVVDTSSHGVGSSSGTASGATITTSFSNEVLFSFIGQNNNTNVFAVSGSSPIPITASYNSNNQLGAYSNLHSTVASNTAFTGATAGAWVIDTVSLH